MFCVSFPIALGLCFPNWHVKHLYCPEHLYRRSEAQPLSESNMSPCSLWPLTSDGWSSLGSEVRAVFSHSSLWGDCVLHLHLCSLTTKWQCPAHLCSLSLCPGLFPTYTGLRMLGLWGWSTGHPKVHWNPVVLPNSRPRLSCSVYINPDSTFSPNIF